MPSCGGALCHTMWEYNRSRAWCWPRQRDLGPTKSLRRWARAGWGKYIAHAICVSNAPSRSRFSRLSFPLTLYASSCFEREAKVISGLNHPHICREPPFFARWQALGIRSRNRSGASGHLEDLERDTTSRLTHLPGRNTFQQWTPDGKGIVFESIRQAASGVYWVLANRVGEAQRLIESQTPIGPSSFSPDGKRLAYVQVSVDGYPQIWTASFEGGHDHPQLGDAEPFLRTSFHHVHPAFSPDGLWMAYSSNESGIYELYVRPVQGPGGK